MEDNIIKKISEYLGSLIDFEDNSNKSNKIRVLLKSNLNNIVSRKIITKRSIYDLSFREYSGDIDKIKDSNLTKIHIKNNIKDNIISKGSRG